jgi:hypothetical protein
MGLWILTSKVRESEELEESEERYRQLFRQDAHARPKSCGLMTKGGVEPQLSLAFSCPAEVPLARLRF